MYREFFHLDDYPFRLTADAGYFFMGEGHALAKAYLNYLLHVRDGLAVITGDPGVGKTIVLENVLGELEDEAVIARVQQTQLDSTEFLLAACLEFGLRPEGRNKAELINTLNEFALAAHFDGKVVILVVDEAHRLKPEVLEEIRMLSNLERYGRKVLNVILVGQSELNFIISPQRRDAFSQRVRLHCHIDPLTEEETRRYIEYRIWIAGGENFIRFPDDALAIVYRYSGGVPRLVNVLCDMALTAACMRERACVDADCVNAAIDKLGWVPYAHRTGGVPAGGHTVHDRTIPAAGRLTIHRDGTYVTDFELDRERILIGRRSNQHLCLGHGKVSRSHAQIVNIAGTYFLQDLNSTNGTLVNNQPVRWHALRDGDVIRIASFELRFASGPDETARRQSEEIRPAPAIRGVAEVGGGGD